MLRRTVSVLLLLHLAQVRALKTDDFWLNSDAFMLTMTTFIQNGQWCIRPDLDAAGLGG